jgi:nucleoid DNA-binding protein
MSEASKIRNSMATNKAKPSASKKTTKTASAKTSKAVAKPAGATMKPIKESLNKTGLVNHLAQNSGVEPKSVKAVLAALEGAVLASVNKKGAGAFVLPGLLKVTAVAVPAKKARKGINPFTKEETVFKAKPATVKLKVRPLKKLKDAAL